MNPRINTISILLLILVSSCHPDKNKLVKESELSMNTTDASELYFKNVRQSEYVLEERPEAGMNIYRLTDLKIADQMSPAIIINWRNDMAFFFYHQNKDDQTNMSFMIGEEIVLFDLSNQKNHLELSRRIYNAILQNEEIRYNGQSVFSQPEHKQMFRRMFFDYLRLVDIR